MPNVIVTVEKLQDARKALIDAYPDAQTDAFKAALKEIDEMELDEGPYSISVTDYDDGTHSVSVSYVSADAPVPSQQDVDNALVLRALEQATSFEEFKRLVG